MLFLSKTSKISFLKDCVRKGRIRNTLIQRTLLRTGASAMHAGTESETNLHSFYRKLIMRMILTFKTSLSESSSFLDSNTAEYCYLKLAKKKE